MRVLTWFGSFEDSRLPKTWDIVVRNCGPQTNFDDCGVFVAACAASVVLQTPAPTSVDGFRAIIANQVVQSAKGEALEWDVVKIYLDSQGEGEHPWWVLFLHQEEGPQLDKFIRDAGLGGTWCHVSHKCHWPWCFNVSHLELVLKAVNDDRSVCKNRSRANGGGCNALHSL